MKKALFTFLFLFLPFLAQAHNIEGDYKISGFDPYLQSKYTGTAKITKNGDLYKIDWTFIDPNGGITYGIGTGIREDNNLSLIIEDLNSSPIWGQIIYKIHSDKLNGHWTYFGLDLIGTEKLKKIED